MNQARHKTEDLVHVRSVFGRPLNMLWLVDAIELALRRRNLGPLRMWWHFKSKRRGSV